MPQPGDVLERFGDILVQQITATHPEYLTAPFTVAEIYQDIVPYRTHRDLIGVEMNGDYEDALIRLLAGEGDYLVLESEAAREELQRELATPNPNTALFREFAAAGVHFHPSRLPLGAGPEVGAELSEAGTFDPGVGGTGAEDVEDNAEVELEAEEQAELAADVQTELEADVQGEAAADPIGAGPLSSLKPEPGRSAEDGVVGHIDTVAAVPPGSPPQERTPGGTLSTDTEPRGVLTVCHWCREDLPVHASIRFCPFCGSDLRPSPCRECGEPMEAQWRFCVSCGTDVRG